jgi:hypothetical protein
LWPTVQFERAHPFGAFIVPFALWLVASIVILAPFKRERILARLPLVLVMANFLLGIALDVLPEAFPQQFATLLGHSIYARDGSAGETWIGRWLTGVSYVFFTGVTVGLVWAFLNIVKDRARLLNMVAVVSAFLFWVVALYLSFRFLG